MYMSIFCLVQTALEEMTAKAAQKDKLVPLLSELTAQLPEGSEERDQLQDQLDTLNKKWTDLSNQISQHKGSLDAAFELASSHEGSLGSLNPWVPDTLQHLENLGPPPTEPEKVQQLKAEIEVGKEFFYAGIQSSNRSF